VYRGRQVEVRDLVESSLAGISVLMASWPNGRAAGRMQRRLLSLCKYVHCIGERWPPMLNLASHQPAIDVRASRKQQGRVTPSSQPTCRSVAPVSSLPVFDSVKLLCMANRVISARDPSLSIASFRSALKHYFSQRTGTRCAVEALCVMRYTIDNNQSAS